MNGTWKSLLKETVRAKDGGYEDFRAHLWGTWGKSDNNRNGQPATARVGLPIYGLVDTPMQSLLSQVTLCDALERTEWDPREVDPRSTVGKMWRFTWNPARRPLIIERPRHGGGGLCLAAFEDLRRFRVDGIEMSPSELFELDVSSLLGVGIGIDQLAVNETLGAWSWRRKKSCQVTRLI